MERKEILKRLGYHFPEQYAKRVIVCTDAHNEADDQYAIVHHLLTPCENVLGIVASHYEYMTNMMCGKAKELGMSEEELQKHLVEHQFAPLHGSVDLSYREAQKILSLMGIDDIPLLRGAADPFRDGEPLPENNGSDFIIQEALKRDEGKLYVCFQGSITDMAVALLKKPEIADNVVVIWIGGGKYPEGGEEFNLMQDVKAADVVFQSGAEVWQIPKDTYTKAVISFAELVRRVKPCGELGAYLVENLFRFHEEIALGSNSGHAVHRDAWILGDNPTVSVLAVEDFGEAYRMEHAPRINDDYSYTPNPDGKLIRVYERVHERFIMEDLIAKLELCYGK